MPAHIFIAEDEESIVSLLKYNLEKEGYKVSTSDNGEDALKQIKDKYPDLILLDWMMPNLSGIEISKQLKKVKKFSDIPIIMLTAKGEEEDKLKAFDVGADDYVTKPFSQKELNARIKSILRRSKPQSSSDIVEFIDLKIDRITKRVYRNKKEINLGPTEFRLLDFFIKNPKRVYSREQLLNNVWGENIYVEARTVDVHIRRLRQAINLEGTIPLIRTVRSAGYSLES
jgi:two-component system phosphate regulon response regulator PhoB